MYYFNWNYDMKKELFSLLILLLILVSCSGNKIEDRFLSDLEDYSEAYNNNNWEKVVSMIYPKLFVITPKDEMIQMMKKLDSVGIKMTLNINNIEKITDIITNGNENFCRIDYNSHMNVAIGTTQLPNIALYKESFESNFGKENVKYDDSKKQFDINAHQSMIAVSNKDSNEWKYIEFNSGQADSIIEQLLPVEVLKKLKK